jgi:hypothetical protein
MCGDEKPFERTQRVTADHYKTEFPLAGWAGKH